MENNNLNVFSKILLFLNELNAMFGDKYKNVFLYYKLCKKTTISNTNGITKHMEYFNRFLLPNKENILRKNFKDLNPTEIRFDKSEKVFVNVQEIMKNTDKPTREVMFKHLHFLLCLVNPDDKSLQQSLLKDVSVVPRTTSSDVTKISVGDSSEKETKESSFINNFVSKVKNNFEASSSQSSNPMEMAMQLMQSGVFSDITTQMKDGFDNGELKIDKLVSNVQSMIGNLTASMSNEENQTADSQSSTDTISSLMNMTQSLMSSISTPQETSNDGATSPEIDLSKIMGMMGSLMPNTGGNNNGGGMPDLSGIMNMISQGGNNNGQPDLSAIMNMMSLGKK